MQPFAADLLIVAADDRTGALEVAGACAAVGAGPVRVVPLGVEPTTAPAGPSAGWSTGSPAGSPAGRIVVVDLGSRHLAADEAARAAAELDGSRPGSPDGSAVAMHKIDSTLRGNWPHELVARARRRQCRVLLVPALPALGRCCVGGEVLEHGRPVAERTGAIDVRAAIVSSRPADLLRAAGASPVAEVAPGASLRAWLTGAHDEARFAVCDAVSEADLAAIGADWTAHAGSVCLAGTSGSIAAGVAALVTGDGAGREARGAVPPPLRAPWLVVAGSLHPATAAQVGALAAAGARTVVLSPGASAGEVAAAVDAAARAGTAIGGTAIGDDDRPGDEVLVLRCARPETARVVPGEAEAAAATLALAASIAWRHGVATLVVLGGDTAAAVLAGRAVDVGGTVAPGVPWGRLVDSASSGSGAGPMLVTKAGAFGDPDLFVRLLPERTPR